MQFKRASDGIALESLADYVKGYIEASQDPIMVLVGTDSTQRGAQTVYATVVCLYKTGKGGHVLFHRERVPRIQDLFRRLWQETQRSMETIQYLRDELPDMPVEQIAVHFDLNPNPVHKSNVAYKASVGFAESFGILPENIQVKPTAPAASCAADLLSR